MVITIYGGGGVRFIIIIIMIIIETKESLSKSIGMEEKRKIMIWN